MQLRKSATHSGWPVMAGLLALSVIPVLAGAVRLLSLTSAAEVTPANARFFAQPLPVELHVIGASLFCVLGAFQFWPGFRRRYPRWHRISGRLLVPAGLVAGLSGLWMTQFYPRVENDGDLLYVIRLFFGVAMVLSIVLGVAAILRRDIDRHRAWMMRGYAIGLGAGTQAATQLPWILLVGYPTELPRALLMGAAWVANLAVAEWFIRRQAGVPAHLALAV